MPKFTIRRFDQSSTVKISIGFAALMLLIVTISKYDELPYFLIVCAFFYLLVWSIVQFIFLIRALYCLPDLEADDLLVCYLNGSNFLLASILSSFIIGFCIGFDTPSDYIFLLSFSAFQGACGSILMIISTGLSLIKKSIITPDISTNALKRKVEPEIRTARIDGESSCHHCGARVKYGDKSCDSCGRDLNG